jgi:hypothetical protein
MLVHLVDGTYELWPEGAWMLGLPDFRLFVAASDRL